MSDTPSPEAAEALDDAQSRTENARHTVAATAGRLGNGKIGPVTAVGELKDADAELATAVESLGRLRHSLDQVGLLPPEPAHEEDVAKP